ncbi:MAG: hypothetical protein ACFB4J_03380 [Elainellaceae cyanobacterium]
MDNRQLLTQTMAFLLCTTPETALGKLLNFCLAAKVEAENSDKTPLEFAQALIDHPETLSTWITDVIDSDDSYSVEEMVALSEMHLNDPQDFMRLLMEQTADVKVAER